MLNKIGWRAAGAGSWIIPETQMRKLLFSIILCLPFTATQPAFADDSTLESVVVTATRTPQPADKTAESITVITAEQIQTQQTDFLTDILDQTPGISLVRNGGAGQNATIGIRGAPAGQTLVLFDGVRINDPSSTDGEALLGDVLANNIDRIEILRGPQSTLYGSDAMGGVVNILTKRGGDAPFALDAMAEGGSFDTLHANVAAHGTAGDVDYGAAANYFISNEISAADARNGNTEKDGTQNAGATANIRWHVSDILSVDLRGYYSHARTSFDGFPPPNFSLTDDPEFGDDALLAGYAGVNLDLLDNRFHNRFALIGSRSDRTDFGTFDFFTGAFSPDQNFFGKGSVARFEYQGIFDIDSANQLSFGAESERTTFSTQSVFDFPPMPTSGGRRLSSGYGQYQTTLFNQLTLTGGVRYDHDSEFGGHTSLKAAAAWTPNDGDTVLHANYGDGFKAPTLYELFSQYSNPFHDLAPESAHGWEVGGEQRLLDGRLDGSVTYFDRRTHNQIDFVSPDCFTPPTPPICKIRPFGYYENIDRSDAKGVELALTAHVTDTLSANADYTWLAPVDLSTGTDLARRARNSASGSLVWAPLPGASLGTSVTYTGSRFDSPGEFNRLPGYTLVNIFGTYPVMDRLSLFARVENLFDEKYEPVLGYGAPGRAAYGGVRVDF